MTLNDFATYVSTKVGQFQANDIAAAKLFLSKRYEMIYNSYLWKDSLTLVSLDFDPVNNPDNANGVLLLPQQIDRVVAVRTALNSVRVNNLEHYYRVDYDAFTANNTNFWGCAAEFAILYPIWVSIAPAANPFQAIPFSGTYDDSSPPDGVLNVPFLVQGSIIRLVGGANEIGVENGPPVTQGETITFSVPEATLTLVGLQNQPYTGQLSGFQPTPPNGTGGPGATVTIQSTDPSDSSLQVKVIWRDATEQYTVTQNLPVVLTPQDNSGFIEIEALFKPQTKGTLQVMVNNVVTGTQGQLNIQLFSGKTLGANDLQSPKYQRIRIFATPTQATTIYVLGKKPFVPLDFGTEIPLIKNLDNCLIAFAMADMLERARQFGKAQQQLAEGAALLKELALLESVQAANHEQFIPQDGYGDEYWGPSGIGYRGGIY